MDPQDSGGQADELAKKTAQLNDEQRLQYQTHVDVMSDIHGPVSEKYRLDVVDTLLQPLPANEQGRQINDAGRREQQRAYRNDQREERAHSVPADPAEQLRSEPTTPVQEGGRRQPTRDDPMAGVRAHGAPRDYSELRRTHAQVAAEQNAERDVTGDSATALLSTEQLHAMAERYAEARKAGNLEPTSSELRERNDQMKMQTEDRGNLDRAHGSAPNEQQKQERTLLDHQQLAERVGVEARMIGEQLRRQEAPGAESYEREARSAFHTARSIHEQRQNFGMETDRTSDATHVVQQQDQPMQSAAQESVRGGNILSSEEPANVHREQGDASTSPEPTGKAALKADLKQAMESKPPREQPHDPDRNIAVPEKAEEEKLGNKADLAADLNAAKENASKGGPNLDPGRSP